MIAILGMFKLVPRWCYEVIIGLGLLLAFGAHERGVVQLRWDAANVAQVLASKEAIDKRTDENKQLATVQAATSLNIQKAHDNEISTLNTRIAGLGRLRVGPALCRSAAGPAETASTTGSDDADTSGRLLSGQVDEAVKQLIRETEEATETGRSAQEFIRNNGMGR